MASLLAKDAYLQDLAKKICAQPGPERQRSKWAVRTKGSEAAGPPKKKRKKTQKKSQEQEQKAMEQKTKPLAKKSPTSSRAKKPMVSKQETSSSSLGSPKGSQGTAPDSVFALDFLRQRLHEKIQLARGQGSTKELSAAALEKRLRRKQERERKKRKRKELRAKQQTYSIISSRRAPNGVRVCRPDSYTVTARFYDTNLKEEDIEFNVN
ncbi:surfeit locus protein 6 [Mastomys coucha]|uniref:surfeit locus protein 6 n=1 Tax=Mastomys coucha TaxID=35658 RepID=UPI00126202A3|nr:surfeit locus protein 6 [Mastomys coucha]